jgi:hypothetical protein
LHQSPRKVIAEEKRHIGYDFFSSILIEAADAMKRLSDPELYSALAAFLE